MVIQKPSSSGSSAEFQGRKSCYHLGGDSTCSTEDRFSDTVRFGRLGRVRWSLDTVDFQRQYVSYLLTVHGRGKLPNLPQSGEVKV